MCTLRVQLWKKTWFTVIPLGGHDNGQCVEQYVCLFADEALNGEHDHYSDVL